MYRIICWLHTFFILIKTNNNEKICNGLNLCFIKYNTTVKFNWEIQTYTVLVSYTIFIICLIYVLPTILFILLKEKENLNIYFFYLQLINILISSSPNVIGLTTSVIIIFRDSKERRNRKRENIREHSV